MTTKLRACGINTCKTLVDPPAVFCADHWAMVSAEAKKEVWRSFKLMNRNQHRREYLAALMKAATEIAAKLEAQAKEPASGA